MRSVFLFLFNILNLVLCRFFSNRKIAVKNSKHRYKIYSFPPMYVCLSVPWGCSGGCISLTDDFSVNDFCSRLWNIVWGQYCSWMDFVVVVVQGILLLSSERRKCDHNTAKHGTLSFLLLNSAKFYSYILSLTSFNPKKCVPFTFSLLFLSALSFPLL